MQRYNFQFTGQRFYRIRDGELAGQVRDVAYQATTTDFWGAMDAVGGPQTYLLGGAFNCGKGQPGQVAAVSHGCPSARFRGISVLNTVAGGCGMSDRGVSQAWCARTRSRSSTPRCRPPPADGCIVVVQSSTEANVRWANNTVTTNGLDPDRCPGSWWRSVGGAAGTVAASAASADSARSVAEVVAAAQAAAMRPRGPDGRRTRSR